MKTTKITIGRLYNLGSYEHVRYEITVELASGDSAEETMIGLEKILEALKPEKNSCVATQGDLERESFRLSELRKDLGKMTEEEFKHRNGWFEGTGVEYVERCQTQYQEKIEKRVAWEKRCADARRALDNVGGASTWKDAKLDWETDEDFAA